MFRKYFGGLRMAVVVPVLAALAALVAVDSASAFHKPAAKPRPHVGKIRPKFPQDGLQAVGMSVFTLDNGGGVLITDVANPSLTMTSGFEQNDVILSYGADPSSLEPVATSKDLDAAISAALSQGALQIYLGIINHRDPNNGGEVHPLYLQ